MFNIATRTLRITLAHIFRYTDLCASFPFYCKHKTNSSKKTHQLEALRRARARARIRLRPSWQGSNLQFNYVEMGNRNEINCPRNAIMPWPVQAVRQRVQRCKDMQHATPIHVCACEMAYLFTYVYTYVYVWMCVCVLALNSTNFFSFTAMRTFSASFCTLLSFFCLMLICHTLSLYSHAFLLLHFGFADLMTAAFKICKLPCSSERVRFLHYFLAFINILTCLIALN